MSEQPSSFICPFHLCLKAITNRLIHRFKWPVRKVMMTEKQYRTFLFMLQNLSLHTENHQKRPYSEAFLNTFESFLKRVNQLQATTTEPRLPLSPSEDVDEFWHMHILDTKKYHQDCTLLFGHYLHHQPGNSAILSLEHASGFENFKILYETLWEEPLTHYAFGLKDLFGGQ